jgi:YVTN family beta-propeller protein
MLPVPHPKRSPFWKPSPVSPLGFILGAYDREVFVEVLARWRLALAFTSLGLTAWAQSYVSPAGIRPALLRPGGATILPGGRIVAPLGDQHVTGSDPLALAISPSGRALVMSNGGSRPYSLTVLQRDKNGPWEATHYAAPRADMGRMAGAETAGAFAGLAFSGEHTVFASEGRSGLVRLVDLSTGDRGRSFDLNQNGFSGSIASDLAFDNERNLLYVADRANSRLAVIDTRSRAPLDTRSRVLASAPVGGEPLALALSPRKDKIYVVRAAAPGAASGDPPGAVCAIDVSEPAAPKLEAAIETANPSGIAIGGGHVFVSNFRDDSITVIDAAANRIEEQIPIRIPGLEQLRGVAPRGLAYHEASGWLLVAESGINAVGVIDTKEHRVIGHLPAAWRPTRVAIDHGTVFVVNAMGLGPSPYPAGFGWRDRPGNLISAGLSTYPLMPAADVEKQTAFVLQSNGFRPKEGKPPALPSGIRYVVLIAKGNRSFDEVLGDVREASNGAVMSEPRLARFGRAGYIDGHRQRLSLHYVNVTPNHHAIAQGWTFSDNYYADPANGGLWLSGSAESPILKHLANHGGPVYSFVDAVRRSGETGVGPAGESAGLRSGSISDQSRATQFIREIEEQFVKTGADLPRFLLVSLPNDRMSSPRPESGFPFESSFIVDNDYALGRIVEYLSGTKWWKQVAVFVTESGLPDGADHIDTYRTALLCAGPWFKHNYVSHTNTSLAGLFKTIFRLLGVPPFGLLDATASDLSDCFASDPDMLAYRASDVDRRIFDPAAVQRALQPAEQVRAKP